MFSIEEIRVVLSLLEKERQRIITIETYYIETPDETKKILGDTYKERLAMISSTIEKLKSIFVSLY